MTKILENDKINHSIKENKDFRYVEAILVKS